MKGLGFEPDKEREKANKELIFQSYNKKGSSWVTIQSQFESLVQVQIL